MSEDRPALRPWIKMCGFTRPSDAREAVLAGADLIGLNFHPSSPRAVSFTRAAQIIAAVRRAEKLALHAKGRPGRRPVRTVAVFVDPHVALVRDVLEQVRPDILQFSGDESPARCRSFAHPFIKAWPRGAAVRPGDIDTYLGDYAVGYLVDTRSPTSYGGGARIVSREAASRALARPHGFLAGGLTPGNVGPIVQAMRPFGLDVASGIESRLGIKSAELMFAFVRAVEAASATDSIPG